MSFLRHIVFLRQGLSLGPRACYYPRLAGQQGSGHLPVSAFSVLGLQAHVSTHSFSSMSSRDGIQGFFCLLGSLQPSYLFIPQFIYIALDTRTPLLFVFGQTCD